MVSEEIALAKSQERLARLKLKQQKVGQASQTKRFKSLTRLQPAPRLSQEQGMLREMFGGSEQLWGTGNNLPRMENSLTSGGGLIKSGDRGETGRFFGL